MKKFKRYLSAEIGIEFKACLYFFAVLFFYSMYRITQGSYSASIVLMAEMILTTYVMGYVQVYLLNNFEEAERFGKKEVMSVLFCTAVYTTASYFLNWYDKNITATLIFFFYILLCYISVFLIYKLKREIDTAELNRELEHFKNRKG